MSRLHVRRLDQAGEHGPADDGYHRATWVRGDGLVADDSATRQSVPGVDTCRPCLVARASRTENCPARGYRNPPHASRALPFGCTVGLTRQEP
jgi:hypothetical protein